MQFRYSLVFFAFALLIVGCSSKYSEVVTDGVEITALSEESAKHLGLMEQYQVDPGFAKWLVSFYDIPGNPP